MPVQKFRDVSNMPPLPPATPETLVARIEAVWHRAHALFPHRYPEGVHRFRSLEAAQASRLAVQADRVRRSAHHADGSS